MSVDAGVQVSVMHRTFQQNWNWPEKSYAVYYRSSDIVRHVGHPVPIGHRGQYKFDSIYIVPISCA